MMMPENHPNTNHFEPVWYSDSPAAIRRARRNIPRGKPCYKDLNLQHLLDDDDGFIHWGTPRKGGWCWIQVNPFKRRPLTEKELDTPYHEWPAKKFKRQRRTARKGLSYESHVRPMLYKQGIRVCTRYDVIPCVELKSTAYAMYYNINRLIVPNALFMALWNMGHCRAKGFNVIHSGGQFAILAHGEKRPSGLQQGFNYTEIWGHFK